MVGLTTRIPERDNEHGSPSRAFEVTSPFVPHQLAHELMVQQDLKEKLGLVIEGHPGMASEELPVILWVDGHEVTQDILHAALAEHEPETQENLLVELMKARDRIEKLESEGKTLGLGDVHDALGLILRFLTGER